MLYAYTLSFFKFHQGKLNSLSYPEFAAEGTVELEVILPAWLVFLNLWQRRKGLFQLLLVFPTMVKFEHGICFQFLLLLPLCGVGQRRELMRNRIKNTEANTVVKANIQGCFQLFKATDRTQRHHPSSRWVLHFKLHDQENVCVILGWEQRPLFVSLQCVPSIMMFI